MRMQEIDIHDYARQLLDAHGDKAVAKAAQKALTNLGARAAASVGTGMGDADLEVARRCRAIWPRLWQTEIARPDADRLAGYAHPLWTRFRKAAGDDPGSRTLFAEMVAEFNRFRRFITSDLILGADWLLEGDFRESETHRWIAERGDPSLLSGLARAKRAAGDGGGAQAALDQLKAVAPEFDSADAHLTYAQALELQGKDVALYDVNP